MAVGGFELPDAAASEAPEASSSALEHTCKRSMVQNATASPLVGVQQREYAQRPQEVPVSIWLSRRTGHVLHEVVIQGRCLCASHLQASHPSWSVHLRSLTLGRVQCTLHRCQLQAMFQRGLLPNMWCRAFWTHNSIKMKIMMKLFWKMCKNGKPEMKHLFDF